MSDEPSRRQNRKTKHITKLQQQKPPKLPTDPFYRKKHTQQELGKRQSKNPRKKKPEIIDDVSTLPLPAKITPDKPSKDFKKETEITDMTNTANVKYSKKEIQSNWHKYEIQSESDDQANEQNCLGADYEQLCQVPLSIGNHFQFKHEKSWDTAVITSEFDKYFGLDLSILALAINSIPFYKRSSIDRKIFNKVDYSNMNHNAKKIKQKYECSKLVMPNEKNAGSQMVVKKSNEVDSKDRDLFLDDELGTEKIQLENCGRMLARDNDIEALLADTTLMHVDPRATEHKRAISDVVSITVQQADQATDVVIGEEKHEELSNKAPQDLEKWLDDFLQS